MSDSIIISVNPATKTKGDISFKKSLTKPHRIFRNSLKKNPFKKFINLLLGINQISNTRWSIKLFLLRVISAVVVLLNVFYNPTLQSNNIIQICGYAFSAMLLLGLLTRISSLSICICSVLLMTFSTSFNDVQTILSELYNNQLLYVAMFSLLCSATGPGRYSFDQIIRNLLFQKRKTCKIRTDCNLDNQASEPYTHIDHGE